MNTLAEVERQGLGQADKAIVLDMSGISKSFGANKAVINVSLRLQAGSVHALMGENGAGKSTLMKILAGVHRPDKGEITLAGRPVQIENPRHALELGISTVFQEMSLLPNLSIAENMFLGREPVGRFGSIDRPRMERETRAALAELGLDLDPGTLVSELSIAQRQFVEIAHGIKADAQVFILDEPTAALNAADVEVLNDQISRLKGLSKAIVYISHRMDEIFTICDTVTVLKDGEHVATQPLQGMTPQQLIALMVGRSIEDLFPARSAQTGEPVLSVRDLQLEAQSELISFSLHRGEILALAGLEGQGQRELVRSLVGAVQPVSGRLTIGEEELTLPLGASTGIRALQGKGVGFVPEDRKEEGLFLGLPIGHNIAIGLHTRQADFGVARNYRDAIERTIADLQVKGGASVGAVEALSGGNQQKVLLGRYMVSNANILLIEEPTRGVDIGAKAEIYSLLRDFTHEGGAVLVLSRETIELIGLCDRLLVVHGNAIVSEMRGADATEHAILNAALGS